MHRRFIPPLLLPLMFLLFATIGSAQEYACGKQPAVLVVTDQAELAGEICAAADKAITFLEQYSLRPQRPIQILLVEEKINSHGYIAYGSYDTRTDRIQLMSYTAILKNSEQPMMYAEPFDRVHYAGAIAHEITHAVFQHNSTVKLISPVAQEYLAHSVQLAVLPEARREAIIRAMKVEPWRSGDVISESYLALGPGKFAAKSYLHLTTIAEPEKFVPLLLNSNWFFINVP